MTQQNNLPNDIRELQGADTEGKVTPSLFHVLSCILFSLYLIIALWGVFTKCSQDFILTRGYLVLRDLSLWERIFYHADLVKWMNELSAGIIFNDNTIVILLNCVLLAPFGLYVTYFSRRKSVWRTTLAAFLFCFCIELTQLLTFWGSFSLADLVTNTFSGYLGTRVYFAVWRPERERVLTVVTAVLIALATPLALYAVIRTGAHLDFYIDLARKALDSF